MKSIDYLVKVFANGDKRWYLNGKLHREDGPAVEWSNGTKFWYLNSKLHREDGPAIEFSDEAKSWYLDGEKLSELEWKKRVDNSESSDYSGKTVVIEDKKYKLVPMEEESC